MANKHAITIAVLADTKNFAKSMKNLSTETGLSKVGNGVKKVGGFLKKATGAAAGLAVAIAAVAIKGGFDRAMKIEDARASLEGLGHSTKSIDKIMGSALESVKGTAFGLGDAATIASTAVAAGIKPGEKLTRTLKLTANTAALAKVGLNEMGSILNKVWTAGKVSTTELNQIADRGIPIWTKLAEHYKVNGTELRKMVSGGKVSAEDFASVLEGTVGNAAEAMGNTTRGAWNNMLAALSRGGEAFLKGVFPYFKKGFTGITGLLDKIAPLAEKLGQTFGRWVEGTVIPALQNLGTWITTTVVPALKELGAWIVSNRATLEELGAKLTEIGQTVLAAFIATLQAAYAALQTTAQWIKNNHDWLVPLVTVIASAVAGYNAYIKVMAIWKAAVVAAKAAQVALNAAMALNPIGLVIAAVAALTAGLVWFFTKTETGKRTWDRIWSGIKSTFQGAMRAIQPVLKELKAYWDVMWPRMKALWDAVGPPLINYIKRLFSVMGSSVGTVFKNMGVVIKTIWNQIKNVIKTALGVIQGIIKTVTSIMKGDWKGAWDGIKQIVTSMTDGIRNTFKNLASGMGEIGKNIIRGLVGGLKSLASAPGEALSAIGSGIKNKFKSILGIHSPSKVFEGFGANIVQGLVSGLDKNRERAGVAITKIANKITDAKHLQGKSALVEYVRAQGRDLDALWKSHDATVKKLAKAKDELKALLDARRSMRDQIASSLSGAVNLGSVVAKDEDGNIAKGKTTKKDVASYVSGLAKKAKTFAARMKDLVAKGWPDSLVQHVAGLGWDEGIEVANALLAKGKGSTAANAAIKADWASIEKSSLSVGKTVSNSMFSVGVDAAQGLVDGLKASAKKTEKAAKDLAKTLAKWVKKELGIASPSKLFRRFGRFTTEGLAIGLTDEASRVTKSMKKVTGLVTDGYNPSLSPTLPNGAQPHTAGSVTYEITVNALTATEEVGRKVVESIKKFERAGGRV